MAERVTVVYEIAPGTEAFETVAETVKKVALVWVCFLSCWRFSCDLFSWSLRRL